MGKPKGRPRTNAIKVKDVRDPQRWGYALNGVIHLDTQCIGLKRLEIILHEAIHILYPDADENEVVRISKVLALTLWKQSYRWVDNQNLQDLQAPDPV